MSSMKRKRLSYTAEFKVMVIEKAEEVGNREAAKLFNLDESNIRLWRKQGMELKNSNRTRRSNRYGQPSWPALEKELNLWISTLKECGIPISANDIGIKARKLAEEMKIENFKGGSTWCYRFMKRNNLTVRSRTTVGKKRPDDREVKVEPLSDDNDDEQKSVHTPEQDAICSSEDISENSRQNGKQEDCENTSSLQIILTEDQTKHNEKEDLHQSDDRAASKDVKPPVLHEEIILINSSTEEGIYDNVVAEKETQIRTSITINTNYSIQKEKLSKSMLSRNKHLPLTKFLARPSPIYSKPQTGSFPKNVQPWKTLEDSYVALTSSNRELLIKLVNQALKKRKNFYSKLSKIHFQWANFEIDASQPSSVFAFGEKIVCHATMPEYPEYTLTLVVSIQQQYDRLQENSEMKYPVFGRFVDCITTELLDNSGDNELESVPATVLVLDHSNITTIECFSECLPEILTEENEKEMCFIILQLIQSLKSLQVQGIESIDTNFQTLLLAKGKQDKYHTLVFLYDICYEENDYSSDSCKTSLCQYTLMLLFQMLRVQSTDAISSSKFSSNMSRKVFETAFSLLSEEKAVSLSQTKTLFECYLWGVTKVLESIENSDDCDGILHRWLDIERSNCIKSIVNEESHDINVHNEFYSQFLIRINVRSVREIVSYLPS